MKKILFLLLFLISITVNANKVYIATAANGGDNGNAGTISDPWLTLAYACTQAVAGDTIMVGVGTFTETAQATVAVGVSIMGAGVTSVINSTYSVTSQYSIVLSSASLTNGNQSISYIKLTGSNFTAHNGILVQSRSNVIVHHCTLENFIYRGINFIYPNSQGELSPIYCTGNKIYNCVLTNCAGWQDGAGGWGALSINGQSTMKIYDNIITQSRALGQNGPPIKGVNGINKDIKIYNNYIYMPAFASPEHYDFAIELWDCRGGVEIYNNYLEGSIDMGGRYNFNQGTTSYTLWIHDNIMGQVSQSLSEYTRGVLIEALYRNEDIIIERNYVKNTCVGVGYGTNTNATFKNIRISYNIFESIGLADSKGTNSKGWGLVVFAGDETVIYDNFEIYNNVFTGKVGTYTTSYGLQLPLGTATNVKIRNNIVLNFDYAGIYGSDGGNPLISCDILSIENNVFYNNGNSNVPRYSGLVPTNNTTQNNLTSDPLFIGGSPYSYKLQETSPARDAGLSVGLTKDYGGYSVPIGSAPDIGAWEYGADVDPPNWTEQGIGWDRMQKKVNFRDTVNFTRGFMISGVPISSSGSGLEILGGLTATVNDLNNTSGSTGNLQGQINSIVASTVDASKADTSLSNLASVAINTHLLPDTAGTINLGSGAKPFAKIFGGSTIVSDLSIGDSTSNTIAKFDSIAVFNGKLYAFIAGDTVGWGILTADSEDITDHVIMLTDTTHTNGKHILYTQWQVDSIFAGFTSGFDSVYIYAKVDSLINVVGEQQSQIDLLWAAIDSLGLGDFNPPTFLSAEVGTFNDSILVVILNDTDVQQDSIPAVGAFTVKENGSAMGIEEIDIGNDTVYISLDTLAIEGYTYTVSYNKDFDYPQLQDSSANITPSWTNRTVTNNVFDAFPSIVSVTETLTNSTDRTSHPITMPEEVEKGDLLLVFFAADATTETDPVSIDTDNSDDGWTHLNPLVEAGSEVACVFWKIADSDGDTLTVITNNAQISVAQTYRITGFESTDPVDFVGSNTATATQYPDPPAATGTYGADDYLWIVVCGGDGWTSYATSAPTDFTGLDVTYIEVGGACSVNTAYRMYNIGTEYNPGTFTSNATDEAFHTFTIIVNPIQ